MRSDIASLSGVTLWCHSLVLLSMYCHSLVLFYILSPSGVTLQCKDKVVLKYPFLPTIIPDMGKSGQDGREVVREFQLPLHNSLYSQPTRITIITTNIIIIIILIIFKVREFQLLLYNSISSQQALLPRIRRFFFPV